MFYTGSGTTGPSRGRPDERAQEAAEADAETPGRAKAGPAHHDARCRHQPAQIA